jgi:hypothetical protein
MLEPDRPDDDTGDSADQHEAQYPIVHLPANNLHWHNDQLHDGRVSECRGDRNPHRNVQEKNEQRRSDHARPNACESNDDGDHEADDEIHGECFQ